MTTEAAQRRLLEAIADLGATPGGVAQLVAGMQPAIEFAQELSPPMAEVFRAISDLASAVNADLHPTEDHHA